MTSIKIGNVPLACVVIPALTIAYILVSNNKLKEEDQEDQQVREKKRLERLQRFDHQSPRKIRSNKGKTSFKEQHKDAKNAMHVKDKSSIPKTTTNIKKLQKKKTKLPKPERFLPKLPQPQKVSDTPSSSTLTDTQSGGGQKEGFHVSGAAPVYCDGIVVFRHLPHLPEQKTAAAMLKRLAQEFMPIIRRRGYDIRTVSEMCCCGDGIDYELGGHRRRVADGQKINGHDQCDCGGYNRTRYSYRRGRIRPETVHSIHLRLRHVEDHTKLYTYERLVDVMCHELAHCVHQNHEPPFWDLMKEIQQDHAVLVRNGGQHNNSVDDFEVVSGVDQSHLNGFDIYGSQSTRMF